MLHPCATDETNDDRVAKVNGRTQLIDNLGWENSRCKSTSKDGIEFGIETTDAHRFEIKIRIDNGHKLSFSIARSSFQQSSSWSRDLPFGFAG